MATLKEFEEALRQNGMTNALAILEGLKKRDRERRSIAPARRVVGRKMTAELARSILELHATTGMTQQEIAFKLGVNQGRVNEVIKRGKWLNADPHAPEAVSRDKAMQRLDQRARARRVKPAAPVGQVDPVAVAPVGPTPATPGAPIERQLPLGRPEPVRSAGEANAARPQHNAMPEGSPSAVLARKPPLRRTLLDTPPIVSAQLAFLDL